MRPALLLLLASLVNDVRALVARQDFAAAEHATASYQSAAGVTPELAASVSWMARGALNAHNYQAADAYAARARQMADSLLPTHRLDADPWLPTAVGASIEVHAQVLAVEGHRAQAIEYLEAQKRLFATTSIAARIQKNINLLGLIGKPAPPLEGVAMSQLHGHPVLLFFWAHWCPDCKAEVPILADLMRTFHSKGLLLVCPTQLYGYAAEGEPAAPAVEQAWTKAVWKQYYAALDPVAIPVSARNFDTYGASTTPTIVLLDAQGIVRDYHPGAESQAELASKIAALR